MYKKQRREVTLIEMMIVMFLIAMIIGVVAYNYQGSLEEGRAFKTKASKEKLETILMVADDPANIESGWREMVRNSPLVQNPDDIIKDGWGDEFQVHYRENKIVVSSTKYKKYSDDHPNSKFRDRN